MNEIILTKDNFDEVVSSGTVLVDFWAPWCGPCRMLAINLEEAAETLKSEGVTLGKVNVDDEMTLADRFNINSIPALMVFKEGQLVKASTGYISTKDIINLVR